MAARGIRGAVTAAANEKDAIVEIRAGTVVGFVGNTGDAAGGPTHDHNKH